MLESSVLLVVLGQGAIGHVFPLLVAFWNDVEVGLSQSVPQLWVQRIFNTAIRAADMSNASSSLSLVVRSPE